MTCKRGVKCRRANEIIDGHHCFYHIIQKEWCNGKSKLDVRAKFLSRPEGIEISAYLERLVLAVLSEETLLTVKETWVCGHWFIETDDGKVSALSSIDFIRKIKTNVINWEWRRKSDFCRF